jgi:predicted nucleic acid-binding protein
VQVIGDQGQDAADPLAKFRSWLGFLSVAIVVNVLFLIGIWSNASDASVGAWTVALVWLPFNVIATVLYIAFMARLARATGGIIYIILCATMIAANWILMSIA